MLLQHSPILCRLVIMDGLLSILKWKATILTLLLLLLVKQLIISKHTLNLMVLKTTHCLFRRPLMRNIKLDGQVMTWIMDILPIHHIIIIRKLL
nr:MAG TPA: hypothetical protein [Caudoviricetes sp.]